MLEIAARRRLGNFEFLVQLVERDRVGMVPQERIEKQMLAFYGCVYARCCGSGVEVGHDRCSHVFVSQNEKACASLAL